MEFVADLVGSLAWPVTVCLAGWALREPIKMVATNMQNAFILRARFAGIEVEFGDVLAAAAEDAAEISQEPGVAADSTDQDVVADLYGLLDLSPRAAVLEAFTRVEAALRDLVTRGETVNVRDRLSGQPSTRGLAAMAEGAGLISGSTVDAIDRLWQVRSTLVHGRTTISTDEAAEYISVTRTVLLPGSHRPQGQGRPA
jgi:hypothetical protein